MTFALIKLVGAFLFLSVLLGVGVIHSRAHWMMKALLIGLILPFGWSFYTGLSDLLGFPVAARAPEEFRYIASLVREPTRSEEGAIFVWIVAENPLPRAILLPYSKQLRDKMNEAKKRSATEPVFMGRRRRDGGAAQTEGGTQAETDALRSAGSQGTARNGSPGSGLTYDFVPPPDTLPRKE
jgi:hypothetical protein